MGAWLGGEWIDLIQSAGIVLGIVLNVVALRESTRGRRISTLLTLAEHHRQIWGEFLQRTELRRVLQREVDLRVDPVTAEEDMFVRFVVIHLQGAYRAAKLGEVASLGDVRADARQFLALPIPAAVWSNVKGVQAEDFVKFIGGPSGETGCE